MGAEWGPIFSGIIIAICLIIAIPFFDIDESDGTYKEKIIQIKIPDLKLEKKSIYNKTEETTENSKIEKIQSNSYRSKIELPINESPKLLFKPAVMTHVRQHLVHRRDTTELFNFGSPDPRFAAPDAPLICTLNKARSNFIKQESRAIGCCPEDDENGIPYGPGKSCCCGQIYLDDGSKFCCTDSCTVMDETTENRSICEPRSIGRAFDDYHEESEEVFEDETSNSSSSTTPNITTTPTTIEAETAPRTTSITTTTSTTTTTTTDLQQCPIIFKNEMIPKSMTVECDDNDYESGSSCKFECPAPFRVNGTDSITCNAGEWNDIAPSCCMGSGCPRDFKLDLYFVVDASSSIGEDNFALVRKFLKSLAEYFDVGQDTVRIGMISFNRKVTQILKLSDVKNKSDLDDAVDRIPYNGKGTNTGKALREVVKNAFVARNGDRPDVQNQVVVITDGKSKDDIKTPGQALKKLAHVMAIGVGVKVRTKDLNEIASGDEFIYTPETYPELDKLKYEVADKHCPPGCI